MRCKWSRQDWSNFVQEQQEQTVQTQMERHLTHCSACMEIYADVLENSIYVLEDKYGPAPDLSQQIMASIHLSEAVSFEALEGNKAKQEQAFIQNKVNKRLTPPQGGMSGHSRKPKKTQAHSFKSVIVHYGIAASLALVLLQSGIFDQMITYTDHSAEMAKQSTEWLEAARKSTEQWFTNLHYLFR